MPQYIDRMLDMDSKHFVYPQDLLAICKAEWAKLQSRLSSSEDPESSIKHDEPPFPSDDHLLQLLQTIYHASLMAEEGRRIGLRVIYALPTTLESPNALNFPRGIARFTRPVDFSVGALFKLAPAVRASESVIVVTPLSSLGSDSRDLAIWGVMSLARTGPISCPEQNLRLCVPPTA